MWLDFWNVMKALVGSGLLGGQFFLVLLSALSATPLLAGITIILVIILLAELDRFSIFLDDVHLLNAAGDLFFVSVGV